MNISARSTIEHLGVGRGPPRRPSLIRRVAALMERPAATKQRWAWVAEPWARLSEPERPLLLPDGVHCVGVAGATLGGSGATPVALALCEALAARGVAVAYVAHGYTGFWSGSGVRRALARSEVCDEARLAARQLEVLGAQVFVAGRRQAALDAAARALPRGGVAILDGALQARPMRFSESLLVVDGEYPWGSGLCPPVGDLLAPRARLLCADHVLALHRGGELSRAVPSRALLVRRSLTALRNAQSGVRRGLAWLAQRDFQLALAIARPQRVIDQLALHGARARRVLEGADHAGLAALLTPKKSSPAEFWVCTEKCWEATLGQQPALARAHASQVWILEERLELPEEWLESLHERFAEPSEPARASDRFDDSQRTEQGC